MAVSKLLLSGVCEDEFTLIAIHCSSQAYKLAYFLNKQFGFKLYRTERDLDFKHKSGIAYYPLYHFYNEDDASDYYLVTNKYRGKSENLQSGGFLFTDEKASFDSYLVPEYKKADFFLKIENEPDDYTQKELVTQLHKMTNVVTAYAVDASTLKSTENLIFN